MNYDEWLSIMGNTTSIYRWLSVHYAMHDKKIVGSEENDSAYDQKPLSHNFIILRSHNWFKILIEISKIIIRKWTALNINKIIGHLEINNLVYFHKMSPELMIPAEILSRL